MFHCENCGREISDWEYYVYDHKCDYCRWVENNNEREDDDNEQINFFSFS